MKSDGDLSDASAGVGEAVLSGGGEVARETERGERVEFAQRHFGRGRIAEELTQQAEQAFDEGGGGIAAKARKALVSEFAGDPGLRDATRDEVRVCVGIDRERGVGAAAIDGERKAFLRVVDGSKIVGHLVKFFGEDHGARKW